MNPFKEHEQDQTGTRISFDTLLPAIQFNQDGLVPAIAQQFDSKEVLMMAWMNTDSLKETLNTGRVCFWSRSRQKLWRKGESSGQQQQLKSLSLDCDGDTILLLVDQTGPACHTGRRSCFFFRADDQAFEIVGDILIDPKTLYKT